MQIHIIIKFHNNKIFQKEPIKRTNTAGTQVLIWRSRPVHPSSQADERGQLDRTECSLITQGRFSKQKNIKKFFENFWIYILFFFS